MQSKKILYFLYFLFTLTFLSCNLSSYNRDSSLVVGVSKAPKTVDPRFATDALGWRLANLLFSSLVRVGDDLKPEGDLAQSWAYKKNENLWEFVLKPNISFSNSQPLTKEDLLFSFNEFLNPESIFHSAFEDIKKVEVIRNEKKLFVIRLHVKRYSAKFLLADLPVIRILPKKEVVRHGKDFYKSIVGSGSFVFGSQNEQQLVLKGRADHPHKPPKIKKLIFKFIKDDLTRYQKLIKGDLDIIQEDVPLSKLKNLEKSKSSLNFNIYKTPSQSTTYLLFNLKNKDLKQRRVRQAIAHSLRLDDLIQYNLEGLAIKASSLLPPKNPFFEKDIKKIFYSLEKSKKLLEKLNLKPLVLKTSNNSTTVRNAKVLIEQMRKAGIPVKLQSFEWGTYYSDLKKGRFDLAFSSFVGILDPDIYRISLHSQQIPPKGRNRGFYINSQVDRLIEEGNSKISYKERFKVYSQIQKKIHGHDIPILPLWHKKFIAVVSKKVKNYKPHPDGGFEPFIKAYKEGKNNY